MSGPKQGMYVISPESVLSGVYMYNVVLECVLIII